MINIRSTRSNRELRIVYADDTHLLVELTGFPLAARVEVWVGHPGEEDRLRSFFAELGRHGRPWRGAKEWGSIEGECAICATCTALGNVVFKLTLQSFDAPEDWSLTAGIDCELGQLERLSAELDSARRVPGQS